MLLMVSTILRLQSCPEADCNVCVMEAMQYENTLLHNLADVAHDQQNNTCRLISTAAVTSTEQLPVTWMTPILIKLDTGEGNRDDETRRAANKPSFWLMNWQSQLLLQSCLKQRETSATLLQLGGGGPP